jgi:hypothetical protein
MSLFVILKDSAFEQAKRATANKQKKSNSTELKALRDILVRCIFCLDLIMIFFIFARKYEFKL